MNIRFLIPGKIRDKNLMAEVDEYVKRLSKYAKVNLAFLSEELLSDHPSEAEIKKALCREAERALKQIKEDEYLILIDVHGKIVDSKEYASLLDQATSRNGNLTFLFGSSYGLEDSLRKRADLSISLSPLTFTHYIALFLVLEQTYRAFKINRGEKYDK